jgi:hypothetical protein
METPMANETVNETVNETESVIQETNPGNLADVVSKNPLLERFNVMPPETYQIPSFGALYTNGELDPEVVNGEILIYPMTMVDEITIRSPDMLFQGTAVESVFKRCIPQVLKPMEMLANDVDYLLTCLRVVTYGEFIELSWKCPKCVEDADGEVKTEHVRVPGEVGNLPEPENVIPSFMVSLLKFLNETKKLEVNSKDLVVVLPTKEVVNLRPSNFGDMLKLYQYDTTKMETPEELVDFMMEGIVSVIDSVNGIKDKNLISEWARLCEAPSIDYLQKKVHAANDWGNKYEYDFECKKCGNVNRGSVPLNPVQFFTTPSDTPIEV